MTLLARRRFLGLAAAFPGMAWLQNPLDRFVLPAVPCTDDPRATPQVASGPEFRAGAPERRSFIEPGLDRPKLVLAGSVVGLRCGRIAKARVDFWQADPQGRYDMQGYRLRGHQLTEADGGYRLETVVPGPVGRRAPRLDVRIEVPGKLVWTSVLFFPDQSRNTSDPNFKPELVMSVRQDGATRSAQFNFTLDL